MSLGNGKGPGVNSPRPKDRNGNERPLTSPDYTPDAEGRGEKDRNTMKISIWGTALVALITYLAGYSHCWYAFAQKEEQCQTYGGVLCESKARVYIPNGEIQVVRKGKDTFEVGPIEAEQVADR